MTKAFFKIQRMYFYSELQSEWHKKCGLEPFKYTDCGQRYTEVNNTHSSLWPDAEPVEVADNNPVNPIKNKSSRESEAQPTS